MKSLSILIPSLHKRRSSLDRLLRSLYAQILALPSDHAALVEVITDVDNKEVTTGEKRNRLLNRALKDYVVFIDDDDHVYPNYVRLILDAIQSGVDCVATCGHYSENGGALILWKLSKRFQNENKHDGQRLVFYRKANHLTPVKRELALKAKFPHISNAEDKAYSEALNPYLNTETEITEPIYHYAYLTYNKEY